MDNVYCVSCRNKTNTTNIKYYTTLSGRYRMAGICTICNNKKSSFVKNVSGKGFNINSLINNLPIELHQFAEKGEFVPGGSFNDQQKYSYCGPGTKYEQRIKEGYKGINELDCMCKLHDQFYNTNKDTKIRNISDIALAHRADEIANNPLLDETQRKDAKFISGIMKTKAALGMGLKKSKNLKRRPGMRN